MRTTKNKILKAFDTAYSTFPAERALHLAQQVYTGVFEVDSSTLTLNDISRDLSELVIADKISLDDVFDEIETSKISGRMSATLIDAFISTEAEKAAEAKAVAEAKAAELKQSTARKVKSRLILCPTCSAEPGLCDCASQAARKLARDKKKTLPPVEPSDASSDEASDAEEDEEDEEEEEVQSTRSTGRMKRLDLNDPGIVLDPQMWTRLATKNSSADLESAIKVQYRDVFDTLRHDATFMASVWMQFSAVLSKSPNAGAVAEAVKGIRLCRARFEFMLGKKQGTLMASVVEAELLDQALPSDLRRARKAGRRAQKEQEKTALKSATQPAPKPGAKKG